MKKLIIVLSVVFMSFTSVSDKPIDRIGVKGPLKFNKTTFELIWTDKPNEKYYIQEYLPNNEKLESFNQMLTIHLFETDVKPDNAVDQKIKELNERKKKDKICNFQVTQSPDGEEFIVDFLLSESKGNDLTVVEFNAYRYKQIEISKNKKGIIVYAYSKRGYGDKITNFFSTLKEDRTNYLNELIMTEIPTIKIN